MKNENGNEPDALARKFPAPETLPGNDLTGRRRVDEDLRGYEKVVEELDEMIVVVDRDYRYIAANRRFLKYRGLERDEVIGHFVSEFLDPETFKTVRQKLDECFEGKVVKYELSYPYPGLGKRHLSLSYFPIEGPQSVDQAACILQDNTDRRRAEVESRLSNSLLHTVDEEIDALFVKDLRGRDQLMSQLAEAQRLANIGSWNWDMESDDRTWSHELYRIFGLARNRPAPDLDTTLFEFVHPDDREMVKSSIQRSIKSKESYSFSFRIIRPDGAERIIHSRGNVVTDSGGNLIRMFGTAQDVTERQHTEKARREAEQKYRGIFENAGEGIFQTTPAGQYLDANPALALMHGFDSPEELIRTRRDITRETYVDPERRKEFRRLLDDHGAVRGFEHQIFRKDGSKIWISVNARAVRDSANQIAYYEGTAQDITERKKAVAALRESEKLFSRAFHSSPAPLIITRLADGCFLNANDAALRAFEYERGEVIGQTIESLNLYADPADQKFLMDELRERGALREFESKARTKSGKILDLQVFVEPVTLKGEQCLLSTAFDITERKEVEAALRESEERYRELFENANDAIYIHDLSGRYVSMNHAAERLSGYPRNEIIGKHFSNFVSPRDLKQVRRNLCKKLDIDLETAYEIELITKDRRRVPVEVVSRLIYENGKAVGVQGTARDISERKRAQEVLQMYSRRLMEAQEAERQSLARELHDEIGQVLTAVRINLQSIQRSGGADLSQLDESVGIVDEALGRVRELSIDLRPSLLDDLGLSAALRWYVDRYAQRTGIIAEVLDGFQDGRRLPRELETACFRIAQAALTNVARHAQASSVSVQLERSREKMLLTVIDDGVGFDLDNLRKNALAASALGLRGMEERALAVGGYIKIDSGAGRGTRIRATFPLRRN